jgi:hypothetical protein
MNITNDWRNLFDPLYRDTTLEVLSDRLKDVASGGEPEIHIPIRSVLIDQIDQYLLAHGYPERRTTNVEAALVFGMFASELADRIEVSDVRDSDEQDLRAVWTNFIAVGAGYHEYHEGPIRDAEKARKEESSRKTSETNRQNANQPRKPDIPSVDDFVAEIRGYIEAGYTQKRYRSVLHAEHMHVAGRSTIDTRLKDAEKLIAISDR